MPLVAPACLAYAIGLLAARLLPAVAVTAWAAFALALGLVALLGYLPRVGSGAALCLLVSAGGLLVGTGASRREATCAASLASAGAWRVTLDADAMPGALVSGRAHQAECDSRARLLVSAGGAGAGDDVAV
ncbi:MAG: hypothetical protein JWN79_491, partial [Gemmatimonadetes bacterium]|nr:hypothetical protein [Gemmatimonadota bacterium]